MPDVFLLTQGMGAFRIWVKAFQFQVAVAMKKKPFIFLTLFVTLLFGFFCTFTLFDKAREADVFSGKKFESYDIEDLCSEKKSNLDDAVLSVILFPPSQNTLFELLPLFFPLNIRLVTTSPVLRC